MRILGLGQRNCWGFIRMLGDFERLRRLWIIWVMGRGFWGLVKYTIIWKYFVNIFCIILIKINIILKSLRLPLNHSNLDKCIYTLHN